MFRSTSFQGVLASCASGPRAHHSSLSLAQVLGNEHYRAALAHIRTAHPYWDRKGGADHLIAFPHDEGACIAPIEMANATFLSSWGRTALHPRNSTTTMPEHRWHVAGAVHKMYASIRCFDPAKDVVLPPYTSMVELARSVHLSEKPDLDRQRELLFHWRGQVPPKMNHHHHHLISLVIITSVMLARAGAAEDDMITSSDHSHHRDRRRRHHEHHAGRCCGRCQDTRSAYAIKSSSSSRAARPTAS